MREMIASPEQIRQALFEDKHKVWEDCEWIYQQKKFSTYAITQVLKEEGFVPRNYDLRVKSTDPFASEAFFSLGAHSLEEAVQEVLDGYMPKDELEHYDAKLWSPSSWQKRTGKYQMFLSREWLDEPNLPNCYQLLVAHEYQKHLRLPPIAEYLIPHVELEEAFKLATVHLEDAIAKFNKFFTEENNNAKKK